MTALRRVGRWVSLALIAALAANGFRGIATEWPQAETTAQMIQAACQALLAAFGAATVVTAFRAASLARVMRLGFAGSAALASGLAPPAWGGQPAAVGVAAGLAALLLAAGLVALLGPARPVTPMPERM